MRHRPPATSQRISVPHRPTPAGLQGFPRPEAARTALPSFIGKRLLPHQPRARMARNQQGAYDNRVCLQLADELVLRQECQTLKANAIGRPKSRAQLDTTLF